MRWVVGTGRCGMHNYTALHGGFIQSAADWKQQALLRYHQEPWDEDHVKAVIRHRIKLPFPCVTDCAQFMFIDLIRQLDPAAEFVWLIREKKACVDAFMEKVGEDKRIHPVGWEFKYDNKRELLNWYYDEVNRLILEQTRGAKVEIVCYENQPRATRESIEALRAYA